MENAYSIIPPIVAILGAVVTKRILPALVVGLLAGSFLKWVVLMMKASLSIEPLTFSIMDHLSSRQTRLHLPLNTIIYYYQLYFKEEAAR